jgi:hypothetical protein
LQDRWPDVKLCSLFEPRVGIAHARNRAARDVDADFLLFADDDVLVEPGWATALIEALSDTSVGAVGGRITPQWSGTPPEWLVGDHAWLVTLADYGDKAFFFSDDGRLPVTANIGIRRRALGGYDPPFDTRLGHRGRVAMGGEENVALRRMARRYRLAYEPRARARHRILPERIEPAGLRRNYLHHGFGWAREHYVLGEPTQPFRRRLRRCARAWHQVALVRWKRSSGDYSRERAAAECEAYLELGRTIEYLTRSHLWLGDRLAGLLGRWIV